MTAPTLLQALLLGYLLGSVPFGLFFTRLSGAGDIRAVGSGNIGATNVLRTGKKWAAAATLLCDGAKGAVAVLAARAFLPPQADIFAALGAVFGHLFPVWLNFKGGKGVATFLGVTLALYWPVGLLAAAIWLGAAFIWRISSLSALIAIALSPLLFLLFHREDYAATALLLSVLIYYMHRENIRRLMKGEEPRIGATRKSADAPTTH
ncbi:MAG TPA: glycerol-3-phosphate 1-O-acyltransferase PlsY [Rhizomicrobium sp.]|jgi:glycerol-3-phosphate acyltransferase PlsY|nr:glycerol-3-phosphate 1-O-acyltransferase PlsY [Rhizomicrobium sp.]